MVPSTFPRRAASRHDRTQFCRTPAAFPRHSLRSQKERPYSMTAISKASFSGTLRAGAAALGLAALLALAACDKGPDQAAVAAQLKSDVEAQLKVIEGSAVPRSISHTGVTVTPADDGRYQVTIEG